MASMYTPQTLQSNRLGSRVFMGVKMGHKTCWLDELAEAAHEGCPFSKKLLQAILNHNIDSCSNLKLVNLF